MWISTQACECAFSVLQIACARFSVNPATCKRYNVPDAPFLGETLGDRPDNNWAYSLSSLSQRLLAASAPDLNAPSCTPYDPCGFVEACALDAGAFAGAGFDGIGSGAEGVAGGLAGGVAV